MSENLGAWHGSQELKDRIVERMRKHRETDDFIQGQYQRIDPRSALGYRGCAIGCALDQQPMRPLAKGPCPCGCDSGEDNRPIDGWHHAFEAQFGIPADVAALIDDCYESLDAPAHAVFAVEALEAIPVGADLSGVWDAWVKVCDASHESPSLLLRLLAGASESVGAR